jgi:hypothetical protein
VISFHCLDILILLFSSPLSSSVTPPDKCDNGTPLSPPPSPTIHRSARTCQPKTFLDNLHRQQLTSSMALVPPLRPLLYCESFWTLTVFTGDFHLPRMIFHVSFFLSKNWIGLLVILILNGKSSLCSNTPENVAAIAPRRPSASAPTTSVKSHLRLQFQFANRTTTWINADAVRLQDPLPTVHYALCK